jgi:hypothetical protein
MGNTFNQKIRYGDFTHETGFTENRLLQVLYVAGFRKIIIFGARETCERGVKARIVRLMGNSFHIYLRSLFHIFLIPQPKILDKNIIAIGEKP